MKVNQQPGNNGLNEPSDIGDSTYLCLIVPCYNEEEMLPAFFGLCNIISGFPGKIIQIGFFKPKKVV